MVGYHGSFWADAATLDVARLEVEADDIPAHVGVLAGGLTMTYARTRIGTTEFLLPRTSELFLKNATGMESRNRGTFEECRQYAGESVIKFGEVDTAPSAAPAPAAKKRPELPAGLNVEMVLNTRIEIPAAAIGDPVRATVSKAARKDNVEFIPKNAVLTGRISRIEQVKELRGAICLVGIVLDRVEFAGQRTAFSGKLASVAFVNSHFSAAAPDKSDLPGEGLLIMRGDRLTVVPALQMVWVTGKP